MNLLSNDISTTEVNIMQASLDLMDDNDSTTIGNATTRDNNNTAATSTTATRSNKDNIKSNNDSDSIDSKKRKEKSFEDNGRLTMSSLQTSDKSLSNEIDKDTIVTTSTKINNIHTGISDNSHTFNYPQANNGNTDVDTNSNVEINTTTNTNNSNTNNHINTIKTESNNPDMVEGTPNHNNINSNTNTNENSMNENDNINNTSGLTSRNPYTFPKDIAPLKKKRNIRLDGAFRFYIRYNAKINIMNLRLIQKKKRLNASQYLQMFAVLPNENKRYYCQYFNENILCNQSITVKDPKDAAKKCRKHIVDAHGLNAMNDEKILQNFNPLMKTYLNEVFNKEKTENDTNSSKLSQKEKYKMEETYYINQLVGLVATSDSPFTLADNKYMQNIIRHNFPSWKELIYRRKTKERLTAIVREIKRVINEHPNNKFNNLIDLDNLDNGEGRDVSVKRIRRAERVSLRDETLDALKLIKKLDRNFGDKFDINHPSESLLKALEEEMELEESLLTANVNEMNIPNGLGNKDIDLNSTNGNANANSSNNSSNNGNFGNNNNVNFNNNNDGNNGNDGSTNNAMTQDTTNNSIGDHSRNTQNNNMNMTLNMSMNHMYRTGIDSVDNENQYITHLNENDINAAQFMSNRNFINKNNITTNNVNINSDTDVNKIKSNDAETLNSMNVLNSMINNTMLHQKATQMNHHSVSQQQQQRQNLNNNNSNINVSRRNLIGEAIVSKDSDSNNNPNTNNDSNNRNNKSNNNDASHQMLSNSMSQSLPQSVQRSLQQSLQHSIEAIRNNGNVNTGDTVVNHNGNMNSNNPLNNDPLQSSGLYNSIIYNTNQDSYNNNNNNVNDNI